MADALARPAALGYRLTTCTLQPVCRPPGAAGGPTVSNETPADGVTSEIHGYSHPDAQPTPWSVGREQVISADTFWLTTVRPDGRPHVTPLIAVWHDDALWFCTGPDERKARNLASNPSCVLTTGASDFGGLDVVLEGVAEPVTDDDELRAGRRRSSPRSTGRRRGTSSCATARSPIAVRVGALWSSGCDPGAASASTRATSRARRRGASRTTVRLDDAPLSSGRSAPGRP